MIRRWHLALALTLAACGARTAPAIDHDAGPPGFDAGRRDAGFDAGTDAGPPWACRHEPVGEPMALFTESRHGEGLAAPELIVIEDGPEARLALAAIHRHFWHPEIHVAEVFVGEAWPDGVRAGRGFVHVGIDAHGNGQLSLTPDGRDVALAWYQGDLAREAPAGVAFRRLDTESWRPMGAVLVEEGAASAYTIVPWAAGYALSYRSTLETEARVGLLDEGGALVGDALVASSRATGPIGTSVAVTEAAPVTATNDETGTFFARVTPAPALAPTGRVDAHPGRRPRSPTIRAQGDSAYAVWREESLDEEDRSFALRVARLDARGELEGVVFDEVAAPVQGPALVVSPTGAVALWGESRDLDGMPNQVGYQAIVLQRVTPDDEVVERLEIETTSLAGYGEPYHAVTLRGGRVLLVTWGATEEGGSDGIVYLARFDCVPL